MCGRFTLTASADAVQKHFALRHNVVTKPRYNIAPAQVIPVIRQPGQLDFLTWGLRPRWLSSDHNGFINARADTVAIKPSFREAFAKRRCLVIADGYYEWKLKASSRAQTREKQPYYFTLASRKLFAMAALWEEETCAIITKDHQPVILSALDYAPWLAQDTKIVQASQLITKEISENFTSYPVSTTVNNTRHDFAACIESLQ